MHRVLRPLVHPPDARRRSERVSVQARHQVPLRGTRGITGLPSFLDTAVEIARESGALLANFFERRIGFELKGEYDLVTEADRASERLIVERLRTHFPTHSIVAEEGGGIENSSEYRWYVDPLDGTTNF